VRPAEGLRRTPVVVLLLVSGPVDELVIGKRRAEAGRGCRRVWMRPVGGVWRTARLRMMGRLCRSWFFAWAEDRKRDLESSLEEEKEGRASGVRVG